MGGEWAVVLPDIFECPWRVLFVIYRRRNRIKKREGKAKVDAV